MKRFITTLLPASVLLFSCNTAYRSSMVNTPLFTSKNEVAITVASNNVQAAYAAGDHVGIMFNGFLKQDVLQSNETGHGGLGYLGEVGAGYFTTLGGSDNLVFETYAGAGYGHLFLNNRYRDANDDIQQRKFDADGLKLFIQPAIGFRIPHFEVSGAIRYSNVNYMNVRTQNWPANELVNSNLDDVGHSNYGFIEPSFTIRAGFRSVKFQFQYINCVKLSSADLNYDTDVINMGVFFKFPSR